MEKVILTPAPKVTRLEDLKPNDNIGFIDNYGHKGYLVYVGDGNGHDKGPIHIHAVKGLSTSTYGNAPNSSYGSFHRNRHHTPQKCLKQLDKSNKEVWVAEVFKFDDRKELYLWLSL